MSLKKAVIIMIMTLSLVMGLSLILTIIYPNNVKCINGLCMPIENSNVPVLAQLEGMFTGLFNTQQWPARWYCGSWTGVQGWNFIISDVITFMSYFGIPIFLIFFLKSRKKDKLPFGNIIWLFAFFILFCGITHFLDALMFWLPVYNFLGFVKLLTAGVSFATFITLTLESKKLIRFKGPEELQRIIEERTSELNTLNLKLNQEIDQRKLDKIKLENSIKENKQLFLELHHRVKNNLQLVINLLDLNFRQRGEGNADWIVDIKRRIQSMSSLHDQLLQTNSVDYTNLRMYVSNLLETIQFSFKSNKQIEVEIEVDSQIRISTHVALNLGLIISELVTNSFKYAFKDQNQGTVYVHASVQNALLNLTVGDDGAGYNLKDIKEGSFGKLLIEDFANNIDAKLDFQSSEKGSVTNLTFRNEQLVT